MLRKLKQGGVILSALLALTGCQSEKLVDDGGSQQGGQVTLTASKGIMSRTHLGSDRKQTVWSEGDRIYVSSADGKVTGTLALTSEPGESTGTFTGYVFGDPNKLAYSVFPVPTNGKTIDLSQVTGGDKLDAPMVGQINNGNVPFENTCGILRLNLQDANGKNFTISANSTDNSEAKFLTTATVKVKDGVASIEYTSSSTGSIALNNAVGGFMYVPYFINQDVKVCVDGIEVATIEKEKEVGGEKVSFIGAIKQEEVKTLAYSENTNSLIEPTEVTIDATQNVANSTLTLNVSSTPDQGGDSSTSTQEAHEFVNIPSITEALTGNGDTEVEVTSVVVELPKITETSTATKSVVSFEEIPQGVTVTIQEETQSDNNKTESVEELTIILPSGTTEEDAKEKVVIDMPNTTVTVKSDDGQILLIQEMTAATADETLIIDKDVEITSLTIMKGSVQVFGKIGQLKRDSQNKDEVTEVIIEVGGEVKQTVGQGFNVVNKNQGQVVPTAFAKYLQETYGADKVTIDKNGNPVIAQDVANSITGLHLEGKGTFETLTGLEQMPNLSQLWANGIGLKSIDVTRNPNLHTLWLESNPGITSIDLTKNVNLVDLRLTSTSISSVDLSKNTKLEGLLLAGMGNLRTVDLSANVNITSFNCRSCRIETVDITPLVKLEKLYCGDQEDNITINVVMTPAQKALWDAEGGWKTYWENAGRVTPVVEGEEPIVTSTAFAKYLQETYGADKVTIDANGNPIISADLAKEVTELNLNGQGTFETLAGIEQFTNLEKLTADNVGLKSINVSNNLALKYLDISNNSGITSLDVTKNINLTNLLMVFSQIPSLDLSKNVNLEGLLLVAMPLNTLDLTNNTKIKSLNCRECKIPILDITPLTSLTELYCGGQQENIDIKVTMTESQKELWDADWYDNWENERVTPVVEGENEGGGEVVGNTITIENPGLGQALMANYQGAANEGLIRVDEVTGNCIISEDFVINGIGNNLRLRDASSVTSLKDLEKFTGVKIVTLNYTGLTSADFSKCVNLEEIRVSGENIASINVDGLTNLKVLECSMSALTTLSLNSSSLEKLVCRNNRITSLDISTLPDLKYLDCGYCQISTLTLNDGLSYLDCRNNKLTSLSVSELPLTDLYCLNNSLTTLDVSQNDELEALQCGNQNAGTTSLELNLGTNEALYNKWINTWYFYDGPVNENVKAYYNGSLIEFNGGVQQGSGTTGAPNFGIEEI